MNRSDKVTVLNRSGSQLSEDAGTLSQDAIGLLEDLYAQARDSAKGYREAAEAATSGAMKARLYGMARRRNAMAGQLEITMRSLGLPTEHDGSVAETLQRYFDELKSKLELGDVRGAISGIVRGEGAFIENIETTLRETLPDAIHGFLERQQRQLRHAIDRFSTDMASEGRLKTIRDKAVQYRKPALIALAAVGIGAVAAALIVQQRRNGAVTRSLSSARHALDRAMAQLPSASQVRSSLGDIQMPSMRLPDVRMPSFGRSKPTFDLSGFKLPSLSRFR
ncbi:MAG: PA2169 family four-helix-bundle protein [Sphingomonadales bacterium]